MKLYVIGNGFDLHHKLHTEYSDYKSFLKEKHPSVYHDSDSFSHYSIHDQLYPILQKLNTTFAYDCSRFSKREFEEYYGIEECSIWTDVESSLDIDYFETMEEFVSDHYPDMSSDSDSRWHNMGFAADDSTSFIDDFINSCFIEWLKSIDIDNVKPDLSLDLDSKFISFNYTLVLENIYMIPNERVFHIHGSLNNADEHGNYDIQFGSPDIDVEYANKKLIEKYGSDEYFEVTLSFAMNPIMSFLEKALKDIKLNYAPLEEFVSDVDADEIHVLGHSFMGVDLPYYEDILIPKYRDSKWIFKCYSRVDFINICYFVNEYHIKNYIIEKW